MEKNKIIITATTRTDAKSAQIKQTAGKSRDKTH